MTHRAIVAINESIISGLDLRVHALSIGFIACPCFTRCVSRYSVFRHTYVTLGLTHIPAHSFV